MDIGLQKRLVNDWNRLGGNVLSAESIGGFKLVFSIGLRGYWFTNRVVSDWNRLGGHAVSAESIGGFKTCIQHRARWILVH